MPLNHSCWSRPTQTCNRKNVYSAASRRASNGLASTLIPINLRTDNEAAPTEAGARFTVWAPSPQRIDLHIVSPRDEVIQLDRDATGMATIDMPDLSVGARYFFRVD